MKTCKHTSWLSLHGNEHIQLRQSSTLSDIVASLENPAKKWPSIVVLGGDVDRSIVMNQVISKTGKCFEDTNAPNVYLQLYQETASSDFPILTAHSHLTSNVILAPEPERKPSCHINTIRDIPWLDSGPAEAINDLHCRLLHPFADVICLFASDQDGLQPIVTRLISWSQARRGLKRRSLSHPRILVVCGSEETRSPAAVHAELLRLMQLQSSHPHSCISSCISVYVNCSIRPLRDQIHYEAEIVRAARAKTHSLLSAAHLDVLFRRACDHFVNSSQDPFDPICASRLHRPVPSSLGSCVGALLTEVKSLEELNRYAVPFIAECLILDNYSHDVHGFDPEQVFSVHYRKACILGVPNLSFSDPPGTSTILLLRARFVYLVEQQFTSRSRAHNLTGRSRSSMLSEFRTWLAPLKTREFCLACLRINSPEHKLPCEHMICEECCTGAGEPAKRDPNLYQLRNCPICAATCNFQVRVKPATAGVRVLSLDGGGIRARVPIQFLRALEHKIGIDMPVQEHFEFGYGTSSGSLVIMALYSLGMRVDEVDELFTKLARHVFRGRDPLATGIFAPFISCSQGLFPAEDIDCCLSQIFGSLTTLTHPYMTAVGARIGFPVVDVNTSETCLITSYNGASSCRPADARPVRGVYKALRSKKPSEDIRVKDAARCATAAPLYFTAGSIPGYGTFVDGGLRFNNPTLLALQEVQKLVPEFRDPDQLVTVGTGTCVNGRENGTSSGLSRFISNSSVGPAVNHYLASFDGTTASNELYSMLSIAGRDPDRWFRRFDLQMEDKLPDLADISAMDDLARVAWAHFASDTAIEELAMAVLASNFYIVLRRMPVYVNGSFFCYGRILSRVSVAHRAFVSLMQRLHLMGARFVIQGRLHRKVKPIMLQTDEVGNFCKPVLLRVQELEDSVDVQVQYSSSRAYGISAQRITVKSLIKLQRLDWVGHDHTKSASLSSNPIHCHLESGAPARKAKRSCDSAMDETT